MMMMMMMMCISRSEVCGRFLAVWWCPKRIQKYRIPKYGLSEEAQAQKRTIIIVIQQFGRSEFFFLFLFFYFSNSYFSFYFSFAKNSCEGCRQIPICIPYQGDTLHAFAMIPRCLAKRTRSYLSLRKSLEVETGRGS